MRFANGGSDISFLVVYFTAEFVLLYLERNAAVGGQIPSMKSHDAKPTIRKSPKSKINKSPKVLLEKLSQPMLEKSPNFSKPSCIKSLKLTDVHSDKLSVAVTEKPPKSAMQKSPIAATDVKRPEKGDSQKGLVSEVSAKSAKTVRKLPKMHFVL